MIEKQKIEMRPADVVMRPERLGAMWGNRLSFMRRTINHIFQNRWRVSILSNKLDAEGQGELIYRVQTHGPDLYYVVFSTNLSEAEREDRVIADRWDAATALIEGELTAERLETLRQGVPNQEYGRAEPGTLVWSRGNRSSRFFNYVVDSLAQGEQPDPVHLNQGGYILRSTAYYANAKFGLTAYERIEQTHPLAGTYIAQMVSAFLFREFSVDLAEHLACYRAEEKGTTAVSLDPAIRRSIGIGNATGMGLVPYVINNPHVVHSWVYARESVLAQVKNRPVDRIDPAVSRLLSRLQHCQAYFEADTVARKGLFTAPDVLVADLSTLIDQLSYYIDTGLVDNTATDLPFAALADYASERCDIEVQELLHSLLIDLYPELANAAEHRLDMARLGPIRPEMSLDELQTEIETRYRWALNLDLNDARASKHFWYFSADSEEPLMGERGVDNGEHVERPLDIPHRIQALAHTLQTLPGRSAETVGWLLLHHPEHRLIVERIQKTAGLTYGEVHTNLMDADVIPLYTQRFQLAQYGMERFNPQSIYWVRVTLMQGAPIAADLKTADGAVPEWDGFSVISKSVGQ